MDKPKLIMMVGLAASGKSHKATELSEEYNAEIFSSDKLREEMFDDVNHQDDNSKLFAELHRRIRECLKSGKSAIYDATNLNYKKRMAFLAELKNIPCEKICVLMATPYEECVKRNAMRERNVPEYVLKRMYTTITIPYYYEGWDEIQIEYADNSIGYYGTYTSFITDYEDYDQHNSHHKLTLGEHCKLTNLNTQLRGASRAACLAAAIHDCGKLETAVFKDSHGNDTDECHYYNHQYTGGYKALFFDTYGLVNNILDVAIRVMWHMQNYFNKEEKTKEKYRKLWGEELYNDIMKLHEADKISH